MQINESEFQAKVIEASKTQPVVVDFWAEWCGPCVAMEPIYQEVANHYQGKVAFHKLNVDQNPKVTQQYGILSIPTTLFFRHGKPVDQVTGLVDKSELTTRVDKLLA
ncbi:thioredoxin [Candidatus Berkelbacteria bacterium]|nr:thioredoxin [Candidatus Berkelbacteria bacterium]